MSTPEIVLLVSCYELGHQPHGLASPLAFLRRAGLPADALDLSVEPFDRGRVERAWFVGISVPMHTALRLGVETAARVREMNPRAPLCFYGLYAALNAGHLLAHGADYVLGGEYEAALADLASALARERAGGAPRGRPAPGRSAPGGLAPEAAGKPILTRLDFPVPARDALPALGRYAHLERDGERLPAGYVEASRGCLHECLHCPIPAVYGGRFFVVPEAVVLEDARRQVRAGARHITFGDPDFLNGPAHSLRLARALAREHPGVSFDVTAKVEHILERRALFPELAGLGCAFVVSAVESLSDRVLERLEKGHTRADVEEALGILDAAGIPMRPSLLPFTPWSGLDDFADLVEFVERRGLIGQVDPVQYAIRLLVPPGSALLGAPDSRDWLGPLDEAAFTYRWRHPDPRLDTLHAAVSRVVERAACAGQDPALTFVQVKALACAAARPAGADARALEDAAGRALESTAAAPPTRRRAPRLSEAWFC